VFAIDLTLAAPTIRAPDRQLFSVRPTLIPRGHVAGRQLATTRSRSGSRLFDGSLIGAPGIAARAESF
jgi:hypothetical protein